MDAVGEAAKKIHGNSKLSENAQTVYGLKNIETGGIEKVGISGGKVDANGIPNRATKQVNQHGNYKYEAVILDKVDAGIGARQKALNLEIKHTKANKGSINKDIHKRPNPDKIK